jgi:hypothetical protein
LADVRILSLSREGNVTRSKKPRREQDPVKNAVAGVERALGKLVDLLDSDDAAVERRALLALHALGPAAVGALGRALGDGAAAPRRHRRVVAALAVLSQDPSRERLAYLTLAGALAVEADPAVVMETVKVIVETGPCYGERPGEDHACGATSEGTGAAGGTD